jgi:tetratricopeptide (TPR) repeat protein
MNNLSEPLQPTVEPFESRVDILFHELALAARWQLPSTLFAIYDSEYVRAEAEAALARRILALGQQVYRIEIREATDTQSLRDLPTLSVPEQTVFFVDGLRRGGVEAGLSAFSTLTRSSDYFAEKNIRIVFWLLEGEAVDLTHYAPDCWALRHRVVEFLDSPTSQELVQFGLDQAWKNCPSRTAAPDDMDRRIALGEALVQELQGGEQAGEASARLLLILALLSWNRGDYEKALNLARAAQEIAALQGDTELQADCLDAFALVMGELGKYDDAKEAYRQAISLAPDQARHFRNFGNLCRQLGQTREALEAFLKAVTLDPDDAFSWTGLGEVYLSEGLNDSAMAAHQKALSLAPTCIVSWIGLGQVHARMNHTRQAIESYREAISLDSRNVAAWESLGDLLLRRHQLEAAQIAYRKLAQIAPTSPVGWAGLGGVFLESGDEERAIEAYNNAVALKSTSGQVYRNLGSLLASRGNYAQAALLLRTSLEFLSDEADRAAALRSLDGIQLFLKDARAAEKSERPQAESRPEAAPDEILEAGPHPEPLLQAQPDAESPMQISTVDFTDLQGLLEVMDEEVHFSMGQHGQMESDGSDILRTDDQLISGDFAVMEAPRIRESQMSFQDQAPQVSDDPPAWNLKGHVHLEAGRYEDAIAAYIRAIELSHGTNWSYINNLTLAYRQKDGAGMEATGDEDEPEPGSRAMEELASELDKLPTLFYTDPPITAADAPTDTSTLEEPEVILHRGTDRDTGDLTSVAYSKPSSGSQYGEINLKTPVSRPPKPLRGYPLSFAGADVDKNLVFDASREDQRYGISPEKKRVPVDEEIIAGQSAPKRHAGATLDTTSEWSVQKVSRRVRGANAPTTAAQWLAQGNALITAGAFDEAIHSYNQSILLAPGSGATYSNLALAYCYKEQYADAIPLYQKSIFLLRTNKEKAIAWNRLGDAYRRLNDQVSAAAAYRNAADLNPGANTLRTRARTALLSNALA